MKYLVDVNAARYAIDADRVSATGLNSAVSATLDATVGTPVHTLRVGDRAIRVVVHSRDSRGRYTLDVDGHRYRVEALGERARMIREAAARAAPPAGPAPIVAPMPGLVVRVNVVVGDTVAAGQGILVMEAMKMENELRSSAAGTVKAVRVAAGTIVEKGAILVDLE